jgi:Na+/H+ antiporter NhaC
MPENKNILNMLIPVLGLIGFTIYFDVDMQMGVICTLILMYVMYLAQNLMDAEEFFDLIIKGLSNMLLPLMLMVLAWSFAAVNDEIGFTEYVINGVANNVPVTILPLAIFVALGFTEFITGTNWGMYIIALPIVLPIAEKTGLDPVIVVSAVLSAGVLGSHCCFYSDATLITSAACGCDNYRHAFTQMPFGLLAGAIAAVGFLICGFFFA